MNAVFRDANLHALNFAGAELMAADFRRANMEGERLPKAARARLRRRVARTRPSRHNSALTVDIPVCARHCSPEPWVLSLVQTAGSAKP
jgi:hypothetical protein